MLEPRTLPDVIARCSATMGARIQAWKCSSLTSLLPDLDRLLVKRDAGETVRPRLPESGLGALTTSLARKRCAEFTEMLSSSDLSRRAHRDRAGDITRSDSKPPADEAADEALELRLMRLSDEADRGQPEEEHKAEVDRKILEEVRMKIIIRRPEATSEATATARMRRLRSTGHARGGAVSRLLVRCSAVLRRKMPAGRLGQGPLGDVRVRPYLSFPQAFGCCGKSRCDPTTSPKEIRDWATLDVPAPADRPR